MNLENHNQNALTGKTVLLINTGSLKKKFILQRIKKLGVKTVVANKEKNWAAPYVDHWILTDTVNHKESLQNIDGFMKENPQIKIDGCLTFWEDDVILAAKIADRYNFFGIPLSVAKIARNKFAFRSFCAKNGLPTPKHKILKNKDDAETATAELSFPLVLKPVFGAGSSFVIKAETSEDFRKIYKYIFKNISSSAESALNDGTEIMVEEYIDGEEVDIDVIVQNGKIKFFSISDNEKTNEPFFIETGHNIPSNLPAKDQKRLIEMVDEVLEKMGAQNGCIHFEAKMTKRGPVPIEVNLRMGGDEIWFFTHSAWRVDLIESALKVAVGIYVTKVEKPETPFKHLACKDFLAQHSGIISNLRFDPSIKDKKFLEEFHFFKKTGDPVFAPPEGYGNLGWITVSGDNHLDAQDNLEEIFSSISYEIARFHPTSSVGKTLRRDQFSFSALNKDILERKGKIEKIRRMSIENQRNLHVGIACNIYEGEGDSLEMTVGRDLMSVGKNIQKTLEDKGYKITFFDFNNLEKAFRDLKESDVDMVFNVCERINNSSLLEPHAAAILDALQIPYTGSNPFTLGLCIDKIRVKKLLSYHKIPTPKWDYVYSLDEEIKKDLKYPLIVKPANTDNSIGITNDSVVTNEIELKRQLEKVIKELKRPALIEEYIEGDEYDVSIIGSEEDDLRVLPLSRSIFDKLPDGVWHIYPFEAKFLHNPVYKNIIVQRPPKNINSKLISLISEIALDTYNILDCHDYGRIEIRVDKNNNPYVLELNPNPSINIGDCVANVAELVGYNYADFLEEIIRMAINRYKNNPPYYHLQPNIM